VFQTPLERHPIRSIGRFAALLGLLSILLLPAAAPVAAADGLTMEAETLLGGHARIGSWMAVSVRLTNDGPPITGELRLGGAQGTSRYGIAVDLPTQSDKTYVLHAQPPAFGRELDVTLVDGTATLASTTVPYTIHDTNQLIVGVIGERPQDLVSAIDLLPNQNQVVPVVLPLDVAELPERVEAWQAIDRLIWQDVDSSALSTAQLAALGNWVASGGRLIVVGGSTGPGALDSFSDDLLPFRPTATIDVAPASLTALLGNAPAGTPDLPALSGDLIAGRSLAVVGDRVIAAERTVGSGVVTVIGFDPSTAWIADATVSESFWRRLVPQRSGQSLNLSSDGDLVNAVAQLPALALPPVGGLFLIIGLYILLVGPINYLVLRRLGHREWAWATIPALIAIFAIGAYGFGASLRGSSVIVNEVAIVRGAPGTTAGTAQVYVGVFSPTRGTYQLRFPDGALLSPPIIGDTFGGGTVGPTLDVLQGEPSQVRNLAVGFGSLRTVRAETPVEVPLIQAELRLEDGRLKGSVTNASQATLTSPAIVLGSTVARLPDLAAGETSTIDVAIRTDSQSSGQSIAEQVVGQPLYDANGRDLDSQRYARYAMINQLTYDPLTGMSTQLPTDGAVILAWSDGEVVPVEIVGESPRRTGNTLYYLPTRIAIDGPTTFTSDLLRSTVVDTDAMFFGKSVDNMNFGKGSATLAYRPIALEGTFTPDQLAIALNFGGDQGNGGEPTPVVPLDGIPDICDAKPAPTDGEITQTVPCEEPVVDGLPETELFDLTTSSWVRLPHITPGSKVSVADPARYVDPVSGTVMVRFVNDVNEQVGFNALLSIRGTVE